MFARGLALLGAWSLATTACDATSDGDAGPPPVAATDEPGKADAFGRKILGVGVDYPADDTLKTREDDLNADMLLRREVAWRTVARVLQEVPLAEAREDLAAEDTQPSIPLWQTWYGWDDLRFMYRKYLESPDTWDADPTYEKLFEAHVSRLDGLRSWPEERYLRELAKVDDDETAGGAAGTFRVGYSPEFARFLMGRGDQAVACAKEDVTAARAAAPGEAPTNPDDNFTLCFDRELPTGAAMVKSHWERADFGKTMPAYSTSAASLKDRLVNDGDWGQPDRTPNPPADQVHTVELRSGGRFRLGGLHVMTKELRHWLWITLWWSDEPDTDFGADRPDYVRQLGGTWSNYKMCVVTAYTESDPDPGRHFDSQEDPNRQSLADAIRAVHIVPAPPVAVGEGEGEGEGEEADGGFVAKAPTWCSNPFLELGPGNQETNCIGCHQHGGTGIKVEDILTKPDAFPDRGRTQIRQAFPADYVWEFEAGERLSRSLGNERTRAGLE